MLKHSRGCLLVFSVVLLLISRASPGQNAGNMLTFDGMNDYVRDIALSTPNILQLPGDFTIEVWINAGTDSNHTSDIMCIVAKGFSWYPNRWGHTYNLGIDNKDGRPVLTIGDGVSKIEQVYGKSNMFVRKWLHVAGVRSQGLLSIYVNGLLEGQKQRTIAQAVNPHGVTLGSSFYNAVRHAFLGSMDEVRFWNVARTPQEIAATYKCILDPQNTPGIVGYFKFDEALNDQNVLDSSKYGNHGYLGNYSWRVDGADPIRLTSTLTGVATCPSAQRYGPNTGMNILSLDWVPGSPNTIGSMVVSKAAPNSPGVLGVSLGPWNVTGGGYTVLIDLSPGQFYPPVPFSYDAGGVMTFPLNLRMPVLAGISFYVQALEGRRTQVYLSNGLRVLFGP